MMTWLLLATPKEQFLMSKHKNIWYHQIHKIFIYYHQQCILNKDAFFTPTMVEFPQDLKPFLSNRSKSMLMASGILN